MKDTSGFYKKINESEWWFAPNAVYHKDYELHRDGNHKPIDGWEWHDKAPLDYLENIAYVNTWEDDDLHGLAMYHISNLPVNK